MNTTKRIRHRRLGSSTFASDETSLNKLRSAAHPFCVVCSQSNPMGLGLHYTLDGDGSVHASFMGHAALEGFEGVLHGGIVAAVLDGAMLHCLFAHGYTGMTAELTIRYRHPAVIGEEMLVRARLMHATPPLFHLQAEVLQGDQVKALATGKFMQRDRRQSSEGTHST
jgi:acyl-coenzyme A thioesterase PaaI-like protein